MTYNEYIEYFESIIKNELANQSAPYDNEMYLDYTKLNWARTRRWFKTGKLSKNLVTETKKISTPQKWIVITEPWCGDAAHSIPFIEMIARLNPLITVSYELRDSKPYKINEYLTNGGKSIPKLIIRNVENNDIATWGPRPKRAQDLYNQLVEESADFERTKTELQNWYNENMGIDLQQEFLQLISKSST
ncbi:thioredoxin family protein [Chryseobacterium sp. M5A1_1a]